MYDSFYGGRQGAPFVIKKYFDSYSAMVNAFKLGPDYNEVLYDEYVMIKPSVASSSTPVEKIGNVYRRGYDYLNTEGGAVFIGEFAGAPGHAAGAYFCNTGTTFENKVNQLVNNGNLKQLTYDTNPVSLMNSTVATSKDTTIKLQTAVLRKEDGSESTYVIGMDIPAPGFKFNATLLDSDSTPYVEKANSSENGNFFSVYNMGIPKGRSVTGAKTCPEVNSSFGSDAGSNGGDNVLYLKLSDYEGIEESQTKIIDNERYYKAGKIGDIITLPFGACITPTEYNSYKGKTDYSNFNSYKNKIIAVDYSNDTTGAQYLGYRFYHVKEDGTWDYAGGTTSEGSVFIISENITASSETFLRAPLNSSFYRTKIININD